jgi:rod shape-determining protein MreC
VVATYRRTRSTRLLVIGLIVTSLVTITVDFRGGEQGPLAAVGRVGSSIVAPLQEGVSAVFRPVGSFFSNLFRAGSIAQENQQLRAQLDIIASQVQYRHALEAQLQILKEQAAIAEELELETFGATVIGGAFGGFEWTIQIDKGSDDGVFEDMAVITGEGLVGQVIRVTDSASTVRLILDHRSSVAVRLGASRTLATLHGQGEGELRLTLTDDDAQIELDDSVVTAAFRVDGIEEGILPPDIPVGVVSQVIPDPTGISGPQVFVRPAIDFSTVEFVSLVRPTADEGGDRGPGE